MLKAIRERIAAKILAPVAAVLVLLFLVLSLYATSLATHEAEANLVQKARDVSNLAAHALGEATKLEKAIEMAPIVQGIDADDDVTDLAIFGETGKHLSGFGTAPPGKTAQMLLALPEVETDDAFEVARPIVYSMLNANGVPEPTSVGVLWMRVSMKNPHARTDAARIRYFAIAGIGFVATMILLAWVVSRLMKPIRQLTRVTAEVVRGDLTQTIRVDSKDEIGQLADAFRQMLDKLREIPKRLQETTTQLMASVESLGTTTTEQSQMVTRQAAAV